jgi:hypothetical protein
VKGIDVESGQHESFDILNIPSHATMILKYNAESMKNYKVQYNFMVLYSEMQ